MQDYEKLGVFYLGREFDPVTRTRGPGLVLYDSRRLITHAVCVGMTGSGKTGLCLAMLEEAAIDGIPALCIDPKGDLGNLMLSFPSLAPSDFLPWVDPAEAQRQDMSVDQLAVVIAQRWKEGLAEWDQSPDRIERFRKSAEVSIYTPGSESGLPLSILRSFAAPRPELLEDPQALGERLNAAAAGLLSLLGREADPLRSRDHVLIASLLESAWRRGVGLDIAGLIAAIRKPPFDKVGALDLETFYPAKERLGLAMALNNLLASPGFGAWLNGEPLDVQRLLFTPQGRPRIAIISVAHLSDAERMFIVTLVLNELVAWMRLQSGTSSLRAIFYMDEIFGYFPPTASPPSKTPMLTLLKQGRAFGLGCVLATQNPVDLDYKGLANAGTWLIGRLQTEQDKARVLEGLDSALPASSGQDRVSLDELIAGLSPRVFLMRCAHDDAPILFESRWALCYLRGPLTGFEISRLMAQQKSRARRDTATPAATRATVPENAFPRPSLPAEVSEYFLAAERGVGTLTYRPMIMGVAKLHFVDAKLGLDEWRTCACLAPLSEDGDAVLWSEAKKIDHLHARLGRSPEDDASYEPLPGPAMRAESYAAWGRSLAAHLYESARAEILVCDALKASSAINESERDFRARLALQAREQRDAAVEELRRRYGQKLTALEERQRRAQERLQREQSQLSHQRMQTALSLGASVLNALLGRRKVSASTINRAASATRTAGRIGREADDVGRATDNLEVVRRQRLELQRQFDEDTAAIERVMDAATAPLRKVAVSPRKSDIAVSEVALVWTPWRRGPDAAPMPAC